MSDAKPRPNPFGLPDPRLGKPSKIHKYCTDPVRAGGKCIWFCKQRLRCTVAWDVSIEDPENCILDLKKFNSWWIRYSLYTFTGVKHVKIWFRNGNKKDGVFRVIETPVNHSEEMAKLLQCAERWSEDLEPGSCGVDIQGISHEDGERCENYYHDDRSEGCRASEARFCRGQAERLQLLPAILNDWWQNGIDAEGFQDICNSGFVKSYSYYAYDIFRDAEMPNGKAVDALKLVRGWRVNLLLWLILAAVIVDLIIVALTTYLSGRLDTGLAAGSYAVGIEALLLGLLTLLSVVLA